MSTWDSDERPTLVTCLACGGHNTFTQQDDGRYRMVTCRWCINGAMTIEQVRAWQAHRDAVGDEGAHHGPGAPPGPRRGP